MPMESVQAIGKKPDQGGGVIGSILGALAGAAAIFLTGGAAAPAVAAAATGGAEAGGALAAGAAGAAEGAGAAAGPAISSAAPAAAKAGLSTLDTIKNTVGTLETGQNVGATIGGMIAPGSGGTAAAGPVANSAPERRLQGAGSTPFDPMQHSAILENSLQALQQAPPQLQQAYQPSLLKAYVIAKGNDFDRSQGGAA